MVVLPVATPVTIPLADPIVATPGVLLDQRPPPVASVSVIVAPTHNADGPTIGAGNGLTVIVALPVIILVQPVIELEATTIYMPAAACRPKSSAPPVPGIGKPTDVPPLNNW